MLELHDIVKRYDTGGNEVLALNGVSLKFRKNEFVSILGASGCGKTTMLNIIGGLDRYTSGDLVINGVSTKKYKDRDWDTYRNHSVGFVFQSYNLISHQTVLSNVELALTLSGVSRAERKKRATEALIKVGLGDQLNKKPGQMSGGQMQRVAIARALVNNPDILLADEPTGALDTATSVQIMELLKEVAKDRLVIMVTHNPELAEEYSTRIVKLSDGKVIDDTDPFDGAEESKFVPEAIDAPHVSVITESCDPEQTSNEDAQVEKIVLDFEAVPDNEIKHKKNRKKEKIKKDKSKGKKKKTSMSFLTALSLSKNNLLTKKGRTALTSFAGSIGIIGIALILSLSTGIQAYIDQVQEDTLSSFPLTVSRETTDLSGLSDAMQQVSDGTQAPPEGYIGVDNSAGTLMNAMTATIQNDVKSFKEYIDAHYDELAPYVNDIQYTYNFDLQVFSGDAKTQVNPTTIFENMGESFEGIGELMDLMGSDSFSVLSEMINNQELLDQQYEVVAGNWPKSANDVVLVISKNNQLTLLSLYMLGEMDQSELADIMSAIASGEQYQPPELPPYSYDHFLGKEFYLLTDSDFYTTTNNTYTVNGQTYPVWTDQRENFDPDDLSAFVAANGEKLRISGIIRPRPEATSASISGSLAYTKALTDKILEKNANTEIINQQKKTPDYNVLTGAPFEKTVFTKDNIYLLFDALDAKTKSTMYSMFKKQVLETFATDPTSFPAETSAALLSNKDLAALVTEIIGKFNTADPSGNMIAYICNGLNAQIQLTDITISDKNLISLLPALDPMQKVTVAMALSKAYDSMEPGAISAICATYIEKIQITDDNISLLIQNLDDENFDKLQSILYENAPQLDATLESNLELLGDAEQADPESINFYAKDFESKEKIEEFIQRYNDQFPEDSPKRIEYTDLIGDLLSAVSIIINVISYVLIAFVSISLIVSSIMIGIITYISVLERTKEIGILRAIGASKRDISRVFNAETLIVGFIAGIVGIGFTLLSIIPINAIVHALTGNTGVNAILPWAAAIILVAISMLLTFIAGLIPSRLASKKDPVVSLRSE